MSTRGFLLQDPQRGSVTECPAGSSLVVGRDEPNSSVDLLCRDPHVSRRHCRLSASGEGTLRVEDLSSYIFLLTVWEDSANEPGQIIYQDDFFSAHSPEYSGSKSGFGRRRP